MRVSNKADKYKKQNNPDSFPLGLFGQVLSHRFVGSEDLWLIWAGVAKLFLFVGVIQVTCQSFQLPGDVKVTVLLTHHLMGEPQEKICYGDTVFILLQAMLMWVFFTFMMLSLGSKLQSAKVKESPSR